jgi:hypothetical protein
MMRPPWASASCRQDASFSLAWQSAVVGSYRSSGIGRYRVDCPDLRLLKEAAMNLKALILTGVALPLFALPALAHPSFAMFDQNKLNTMTGTVKQFEWQNPHAWLQIEIADANGKAAIWSFEGGSPAQLAALGWKPENFHAGDKVEVGFRPLKEVPCSQS